MSIILFNYYREKDHEIITINVLALNRDQSGRYIGGAFKVARGLAQLIFDVPCLGRVNYAW